MLILFTDTDCDITPSMAKQYGYRLISMPYVIDQKIVFPYKDFDKFEAKKYYNALRRGVLPTTCALNPEEYREYFEPIFANGDDILYVHFSKQMSGTFNSLNLAIQDLKEKYPNRKYYEIDTKGITVGAINIVLEIGEMYKNGKSVEELIEWSKTEVDKFACYFFADNLKFFRRSGRVSGLSAFMGDLVGIKPIITMDSTGVMKSIGKEKGRARAAKKLVDYVESLQENLDKHKVIIAHTDADELVKLVKKLLKEKFQNKLDIMVVDVNPTAGAHCGPDSLGISFHAIHR